MPRKKNDHMNSPFPLEEAKKVQPKPKPRKRTPKVAPKVVKVEEKGVKLISSENKEEWLSEVNGALNDGWELVSIFVKHYDYVAAVRKNT